VIKIFRIQDIHDTVKNIISSGRIGVPVFVKFLVQVPLENKNSGDIVNKAITIISLWLDSKPLNIYAQQASGLMHINAIIQYEDGQTAIFGMSKLPGINISMDIMILGNKGGIYHDNVILSDIDTEFETLFVPDWINLAINRSIDERRPILAKEVSSSE